LPLGWEQTVASLVKQTGQTAAIVEAVLRIVYEYIFIPTVSNRPAAVGLYEYASIINHSCRPNVMWVNSKQEGGSCHLLALRPIASGEELFVSYRDLIRVDSYRYNSILALYDIFNNQLCRCGEDVCVHRGWTVDTLPLVRLEFWCTSLEDAPPSDLAAAFLQMAASPSMSKSSSISVSSDLMDLKVTDSAVGKNKYMSLSSSESRLVQLLLLIWHSVAEHQFDVTEWLKQASRSDSKQAIAISDSIHQAVAVVVTQDAHCQLYIAQLEWLLVSQSLKPLTSSISKVPLSLLEFLSSRQ
jgi:hypothetical protein